LTLNVLLSFAQFERELSSERVRDKIAASRRKGKWTGGTVPLGYDARDKKLVINKAEAETVRTIFRLYLELKSFGKLVAELDRRSIVTKRRDTKVAKYNGGIPFTYGPLAYFASTSARFTTAASGSRANSRPSSTDRPLNEFRPCSRLMPTAARSNTSKAVPSYGASSMTIRATSWARAFPARTACAIVFMSARRYCAGARPKLDRSAVSLRRRSRARSLPPFTRIKGGKDPQTTRLKCLSASSLPAIIYL
jgi:hypothetical protein